MSVPPLLLGTPGVAFGLDAGWALAGLALLPVVAWLYRRRPRFERREVPSLMFLGEAPSGLVRRHRRALDVDLLLALCAVGLLVLAAAQPAFGALRRERVLRVVVAGGAPATQRGYRERVERALAGLRAALGPDDRLEVEEVPAPSSLAVAPRPAPETLLAAARAGRPDRAWVVSDVVVEAPDVAALAVGDPAHGNLGIVAVTWEPGRSSGEPERVFATLWNASPRPARATLVLARERAGVGPLAQRPLRLGPDEVQSVLLEVPAGVRQVELGLNHEAPEEDALAADDHVVLRRRGLRLAFDAQGLPAAHQAAVLRALQAALGGDGVTLEADPNATVDVRVERLAADAPARDPAGPLVLALAVVEPGGVGRPVAGGPEVRRASPWIEDVSLAGLALERGEASPRAATWWLSRGTGPDAGLLGEDASGRVLVAYDVTRGTPPPAEHPAWPILIDNVVRQVLGREDAVAAGRGAGRLGLLDAASTRLGRDRRAFDAAWLAAAPAREVGATRGLAPALAALGVLLLVALWWREARRTAAAG